jgi:hypothetical protein
MKKIIVLLLILNGCAYKPIIDSAGRSGTFPTSTAEQVTNDIQHCKMLAEEHLSKADVAGAWFTNNVLRPYTLFIIPEEKRTRENYARTCLKNRGHSVIY